MWLIFRILFILPLNVLLKESSSLWVKRDTDLLGVSVNTCLFDVPTSLPFLAARNGWKFQWDSWVWGCTTLLSLGQSCVKARPNRQHMAMVKKVNETIAEAQSIFVSVSLSNTLFSTKVSNVVTLDAENSYEYAYSILKAQEWINNVELEHNLPDFIGEENGDGNIDLPVSDNEILYNIESANKLLVGAIEKPKTPERLTPFKISTTSSEQNTYHLSGLLKELLVDTSEKSCSNEKGDSLNFTNADFEMEEPELIEIFKSPIAMND
ncbi:hypothetical protein TNCV_2545831 [Trichonephila clavipes]|nr:hypothetical protein TNCV_2545831 [Trichonephila clavipes]